MLEFTSYYQVMFSRTSHKIMTPVSSLSVSGGKTINRSMSVQDSVRTTQKVSPGKRLKYFPSTLRRRRHSIISTVKPWPNVHPNPSRKRSFSKTLFKPEEFENYGSEFSCGLKIFCKRNFSKTMALS